MKTYNDLFISLPEHREPGLAELIAQYSHTVRLPEKMIYVSPGDLVDTIIYIAEGKTISYMINFGGQEKVSYILSAGWFLRESAFVRSVPKTALRYLRAETATVLFSINRSNYEKLMCYPLFSKALLRSASVKNEMVRRQAESLALDSGQSRLLKLLFSLADSDQLIDGAWHPLLVRYTHQQMSAIIGVNRVTVSRYISELCNEGKIRIVNRKIEVRRGLVFN